MQPRMLDCSSADAAVQYPCCSTCRALNLHLPHMAAMQHNDTPAQKAHHLEQQASGYFPKLIMYGSLCYSSDCDIWVRVCVSPFLTTLV